MVLFPLLLTLVASECPVYQCSARLDHNVCLNQTDVRAFAINANGCDTGYSCSVTGAMNWSIVASTNTTETTEYLCEPLTDGENNNATEWAGYSCPAQLPDRGFRNGMDTYLCIEDADCVLQDDTSATCQCVFRSDGKGLCQPDIGNDVVYSGFWQACGLTGQITDEDTYKYWSLYTVLYVYSKANVTCSDVFWEMETFAGLEYPSAATWGLACGLYVAAIG